MKNIRIFVGVAVLLLLIPVGFLLIFKRVPPDVIGVKQLRWGGGGILSEDFHAGFKVGISGLHLWHYLPRQTHFLHFSRSSVSRGAIDSWEPAQEIRTTDNNVVSVDLSIPYRIVVGKGHRIIQEGLKHEYRDRVKSTVERVLRSELSTLTSEDFQDTDKRRQKSKDILPVLNEQLRDFYCVAEEVLIRRFRFSGEYEAKLQEKQYLEQKAFLDVALTGQANEQKTVNLIERQIVAAE
ncbi:MAG: hypothetical protein MK213_08085, partial [Planctomycetes bacterium]|nr:hypothetical protein [Planctomycetota bacterium]